MTLTRVQSAAGALELNHTRASATEDLSLGCVIELSDGREAIVQALGDAVGGPPRTALPVVRLKSRADGESLTFDLRQVRELRRALIYGYSPSVSPITWQGVLVLTTYAGARIEVPFDLPPLSGTTALLTIFNVAGELVLRSELEPFAGPPQMAAEAYDHHPVWLDGQQPLP